MIEKIYDYDFLIKLCEERNIVLTKDYLGIHINNATIIEGQCEKFTECNKYFSKIFSRFHKLNSLCKECADKLGKEKRKKTNLEKYGFESPFGNSEIKEKSKKTCLDKYGVENPLQNKEIKEKSKNTCLKKYGTEFAFQNENVKEKIKHSNLIIYGVENPSQNSEIKERMKKTNMNKYGREFACQNENVKEKIKQSNLEKYGVECTFESSEIKEKSKNTCLDKYGFDHAMKCDEIKDKLKESMINKYGFEYTFQVEEIQNKIKESVIKKYGVENVMQNSDIADKCSKTAYNVKDYVFPSGKIDKIQGYEHYALDDLLCNEKIKEEDIVITRSKVPEIWYVDEKNKKHRYFVDIFIPHQNRCIEVKSTWTYKKKEDNVFVKQQAVLDAGYSCEIWIYNNKGKKLEIHKKPPN